MARQDVYMRFMSKISINAETGCWEWQAAISPTGYAMFFADGKNVKGHRWAYEYFIGPMDKDKVSDHLCRTRHCVNPSHIEPVTIVENLQRSPIWNGNKEYCKHGHEFDEKNTYWCKQTNGNTKRACRECLKRRTAEWRAKKKAQAAVSGCPRCFIENKACARHCDPAVCSDQAHV